MSATPPVPSAFPQKFTLAQFTRSAKAAQLGIPNAPTPEHERALRALAWHILVPLRDALGGPILISSGYRSPLLNSKTKGSSKTSQHSRGEAVDLVPADGAPFTTRDIFDYIRKHLPFDQLIWEYGDKAAPQWVHVSYTILRPRRNIILRTTGTRDDPTYAPWSPTW